MRATDERLGVQAADGAQLKASISALESQLSEIAAHYKASISALESQLSELERLDTLEAALDRTDKRLRVLDERLEVKRIQRA